MKNKAKKLVTIVLGCTMILGSTLAVSAAPAVKCPVCNISGEWVSPSYTATCDICGGEIAYYECETAHHKFQTNHWH